MVVQASNETVKAKPVNAVLAIKTVVITANAKVVENFVEKVPLLETAVAH